MGEWLSTPRTAKTSVERPRSSANVAVGKNAESVHGLSRGPSMVRYSKREFTPFNEHDLMRREFTHFQTDHLVVIVVTLK